MADRTKDARLTRMAAALSHLRDLEQQTGTIILDIETGRMQMSSPPPNHRYRLLSSGRPAGVDRAVCVDVPRGSRTLSSASPFLRLCPNVAKGAKRRHRPASVPKLD
jgi:hypothetical protein